MKNLTQKQQEIISQIEKEFSLANKQQVNGCDDIFAFIDSAVNEKKQYAEECKRNNAILEKAIKCNAEGIVERINDVLERYGFECIVEYVSRTYELIEYYKLKIIFNGFNDDWRKPQYKELFLWAKIGNSDKIWSYKDSSIRICENYRSDSVIADNDLEKYIASLIIEKLKSKIK